MILSNANLLLITPLKSIIMTEYDDLMQQTEEHNKKMHRTKDINVNDCLTFQDRDAIAKVIDNRVAKEYGDMYPFRWQFSCEGHFIC